MSHSPLVYVVQEYVPRYRAPLFSAMRAGAATRGIDLRLIAGDPQKLQAARRDRSEIEIDRVLRQREFRFLGRRLTLRNARSLSRGADLVVIEQARRNLDAYVDLIARPGRIAMWGHGRDYTSHGSQIHEGLLSALTNRATWFFGYTPASVRAVTAHGFPEARTTVLWNTVDTQLLRSQLDRIDQREAEDFRLEVGNPDSLAIFVGALDQSKRLPFLIQASDQIASTRPGFRLLLCGDGPESERIHSMAASRPWITIRTSVFGRDLALTLRSADALAMPGRVGLVAVDALVANLPLVTTAWPNHAPERDYLNDGNSATSADSVSAFASVLERVLYDKQENHRLRSGATDVSPLLTIDGMAERFLDGIEAALAGPRPKASRARRFA